MDIQDLSPEQIEKAKRRKTVEELYELAMEEGIELNDGELKAVSAGTWSGETDGCSSHTCIGYDCFFFGCRSVDCKDLQCTLY